MIPAKEAAAFIAAIGSFIQGLAASLRPCWHDTLQPSHRHWGRCSDSSHIILRCVYICLYSDIHKLHIYVHVLKDDDLVVEPLNNSPARMLTAWQAEAVFSSGLLAERMRRPQTTLLRSWQVRVEVSEVIIMCKVLNAGELLPAFA